MALNMHSDYTAMSEINVTPLVDVMLVLLVIFMVTAPFMMQSVQVNLPKTAPVAKLPDVKALDLMINAGGEVFVDQKQVAGQDLEGQLKQYAAEHENVSIRLKADELVPYGRIAQVMAAVNRAGIAKLTFVTTESSELHAK
ncbi:MAG: biopolymer transporter ExbD [Thiobacillaceae bacterium]